MRKLCEKNMSAQEALLCHQRHQERRPDSVVQEQGSSNPGSCHLPTASLDPLLPLNLTHECQTALRNSRELPCYPFDIETFRKLVLCC